MKEKNSFDIEFDDFQLLKGFLNKKIICKFFLHFVLFLKFCKIISKNKVNEK